MKKILLLALMSGGIFSAVNAMMRERIGLMSTLIIPETAIINNTLNDDIQVKFEFLGDMAPETINIPAKSKGSFSFKALSKNLDRKKPVSVTVTIVKPKSMMQKVKHLIAGSSVFNRLNFSCFDMIDIESSAFDASGFTVKVQDCREYSDMDMDIIIKQGGNLG